MPAETAGSLRSTRTIFQVSSPSSLPECAVSSRSRSAFVCVRPKTSMDSFRPRSCPHANATEDCASGLLSAIAADLEHVADDRFWNLADALPIMVWTTDDEDRLTFVNRAWLEYTGLPAGSTIDERNALVHPLDLPVLMRALRTGRQEVDFRMRRRSDEMYRWHLLRWVHFASADLPFYRVGTAMDVHDQRTANEVRDRQLRTIAEALPDIVWSANPQGEHDYANEALLNTPGGRSCNARATHGSSSSARSIGRRPANAGCTRLRPASRTKCSIVLPTPRADRAGFSRARRRCAMKQGESSAGSAPAPTSTIKSASHRSRPIWPSLAVSPTARSNSTVHCVTFAKRRFRCSPIRVRSTS